MDAIADRQLGASLTGLDADPKRSELLASTAKLNELKDEEDFRLWAAVMGIAAAVAVLLVIIMESNVLWAMILNYGKS